MIRYLKNIILTALFLGLITTNILTLLYQPFNTALSAAISSAFGIATVSSLMSEAIELKDLEIKKLKKSKQKLQKSLQVKNQQIKQMKLQTIKMKRAIKKFGHSISTRTRKIVLRSLAGIPGKSIPVIGGGLVVGSTLWETRSACQNLEDIQQLQQEFGVGQEAGKGIMETVCEGLF